MKHLSTESYIREFFVEHLSTMIESHPYHSFICMAAGIEFLGKAISNRKDLQKRGHSKEDFNNAIAKLGAFERYRQYSGKDKYNFYESFRCGLLHATVTKHSITLSSKNEQAHLVEFGNQLNLRCEDFFHDFKAACFEVIEKHNAGDNYPIFRDKFMQVPDYGDSNCPLTSGTTMF